MDGSRTAAAGLRERVDGGERGKTDEAPKRPQHKKRQRQEHREGLRENKDFAAAAVVARSLPHPHTAAAAAFVHHG